jgi:hypothetical protein
LQLPDKFRQFYFSEKESQMAVKFRRQLHQSGMSMINKCGQQFKFVYIDHRRRPTASFLISGTAVDQSVGHNLNTKILTGELAPKEEVLDVARDSVANNPDSLVVEAIEEEEKGKSREQIVSMAKDKAVRLSESHHGLVAPTITPFRVARKFSVNLDKFLRARAKSLHEDAEHADTSWQKRVIHAQAAALNSAARQGWDFVGEQDIVQGTCDATGNKLDTNLPFEIRDTKTGKKSKNQSDIDQDDQLTAYSMASMVIDGRIPDAVRLDVMVDLKGGVKPQLLQSFRKEADVDVFMNRVANAVSAIQQGVFVPTQETSWWCDKRYCAFTDICPYFKKPRSVFMPSTLEGTADDRMPKLVQIKPTGE